MSAISTAIGDIESRIRERELTMIEKEEVEKQEEARKNKGFTQTYPRGWKRIRNLAKKSAGAVGLYSFFAEHIDPSCGAVVCDQQFLANHMEVSRSTIKRWLNYLENEGALVRIPVAGKVCAYALDPYEVWKGYNTSKEYAAFMTKTLVNQDGNIKRRIMSMFHPEKLPEENK